MSACDPTTGRVFVAGPFKALVDSTTGTMHAPDRGRLTALMERLEHDGYQVDNAHRREQWGAAFLSPEQCTRLDFEEISASDVLVAFPGAPPSPGTHIELGWASALGKPIVAVVETGQDHAFLVRGLHVVADVTYVEFSPNTDTDTDADVVDRVAAAVSRATATARAPAGSDEPARPHTLQPRQE